MKLTSEEKQILLEACERVYLGKNMPSCSAIFEAGNSYNRPLIVKYCRFYEKEVGSLWIGSSEFYDEMHEAGLVKDWRQTLILFFLEAHEAVE